MGRRVKVPQYFREAQQILSSRTIPSVGGGAGVHVPLPAGAGEGVTTTSADSDSSVEETSGIRLGVSEPNVRCNPTVGGRAGTDIEQICVVHLRTTSNEFFIGVLAHKLLIQNECRGSRLKIFYICSSGKCRNRLT